jgi:hypothetical protein
VPAAAGHSPRPQWLEQDAQSPEQVLPQQQGRADSLTASESLSTPQAIGDVHMLRRLLSVPLPLPPLLLLASGCSQLVKEPPAAPPSRSQPSSS